MRTVLTLLILTLERRYERGNMFIVCCYNPRYQLLTICSYPVFDPNWGKDLCSRCLIHQLERTQPQLPKKRVTKGKKRQTLAKRGKKAKMSKGPRLCPDERLRSRLYEPLVLLHVLDRNGEQRISRCPSEDLVAPQLQQLRELRRDFLEKLAYICDHVKGGDTVTAIALEAHPSGITFWVASNAELSAGTISFLQEILNTLKSLASLTPEHSRVTIEDKIALRCIGFNLKRIKAYQTLMRRPLQRTLTEWLERFQGFNNDLPGLCRFSYQQRMSQCMRDLQRHIGEERAEVGKESRRQNFLLTRHFIGRLGSHFKAARILTTAGWRMPELFDSFTIKTRPSPKPPSLPPPTDHLTTLSGIIKRMLPAGSEALQYQDALAIMDAKFNIQNRLQAQFEDIRFRPRVHSELTLLEYFHTNRIPFVDDDRFIGCSKPACYCCYHYISLHPGGFVRPSSHGIRYLNWRPPDLVNAENATEKNQQRDVLNKVIAQIRLDTLRQIEQRRGPSLWHPDSTTGITGSQQYAPVDDVDSCKSSRLDL
ncbi:hypothetical protein ACLOAV_005841 [Pseudogymnoascus australis]